MISREDVSKLSKLARIGLKEKEVANLQKDLSNILDFVSVLDKVSQAFDKREKTDGEINVFRSDEKKFKNIEHSESLLRVAPRTENGYFKVKKII